MCIRDRLGIPPAIGYTGPQTTWAVGEHEPPHRCHLPQRCPGGWWRVLRADPGPLHHGHRSMDVGADYGHRGAQSTSLSSAELLAHSNDGDVGGGGSRSCLTNGRRAVSHTLRRSRIYAFTQTSFMALRNSAKSAKHVSLAAHACFAHASRRAHLAPSPSCLLYTSPSPRD